VDGAGEEADKREREREREREEGRGETSFKSAIIYAPLVSSSCIPNVYE